MKKHKMVLLAILSIFMLGIIFPAYADQKQQQLQEVNRQIQQQKANLNSTKKKETDIMSQLNNIEKSMSQTQNEIDATNDRIAYLEHNIQTTQKNIDKQQKDLDEQTETLGDRLVEIYETGDTSYLEVLLSAEDLKDFITRYDMLGSIVEQDVDLIKTINKQKKELALKKSELEDKTKGTGQRPGKSGKPKSNPGRTERRETRGIRECSKGKIPVCHRLWLRWSSPPAKLRP